MLVMVEKDNIVEGDGAEDDSVAGSDVAINFSRGEDGSFVNPKGKTWYLYSPIAVIQVVNSSLLFFCAGF